MGKCVINVFFVRSPEFWGWPRLANDHQAAILNLTKCVFRRPSWPTVWSICFIGQPCTEMSHFCHDGVCGLVWLENCAVAMAGTN
ncbi:hypothetical protein EUGRSUZ_G01499 [Eucalyptus grandis]|uniref:Uncharacterized protein n=2 Tax=Eucalyptus grandis TaxID=71139 RepID=A0ACC3K334_EUCGR|nr:hypothetical protein EUGRSUZ_G01499 [Eucalyptus grandis]